MNNPTPLFYINPIIEENKKRYIYGTDNNAFKLFAKLANYRVYIDGFINDSESSKKLIHKPVISLSDAIEQNALILSWNDIEINAPNPYLGAENIFLLPDDIIKNGIIIWGSGKIGASLCEYFIENNITIHSVIDNNSFKWGTTVCNIPVKRPATLSRFPSNIPIVEATKKYWEIDLSLNQLNETAKKRYYQERILNYPDSIMVDSFNDLNISFCDIDLLGKFYDTQNFWIYGTYNISQNYIEILRLLDFKVKGFLYDDEVLDKPEKISNEEKCYVEEIIYEENPFILIVDNYRKRIDYLEKMGFTSPDNYLKANLMAYLKNNIKINLDINLGYTYSYGTYPGFKLIGQDKPTDYRIAVLGGSTTDGYLYPFKSWPDFLYERLAQNVTIYNGGVIGYDSVCELQKMMRDILFLKPKMVLVYDGYNDTVQNHRKLFDASYLSTIYDYAYKGMEEYQHNTKPWSGFPITDNTFDAWLYRIEMMHLIAEYYQINFFVFAQPHLLTKKYLNEHELLMERYRKYTIEDEQDQLLDSTNQFIKRLSNPDFKKSHPYIYNLMDILDDTEDVYIDHCHIWEHGNKIVAEEIYKYIYSYIQ